MSDADVRAHLAEMRRSMKRRAADLGVGFDAIVAAASDVATDDEHDPEGHTIAWERRQLAALLAETQVVLAGIDAAERRLDEGRYGISTVCGRPISAERLEALPAAATCVTCASTTSRRRG